MEKSFTFSGNIRRNSGGQIIVDKCESDQWHLRHSDTDTEQNRPLCRKTVETYLEGLVGKAGKLTVSIRFEEDCVGAVPQDEAHTAETVKVYVPLWTETCSPPGMLADAVIAALEDLDGN